MGVCGRALNTTCCNLAKILFRGICIQEDSGLFQLQKLNISLTGILYLMEIWLILLLLQNNEIYLIVLYNKTLSKVPFFKKMCHLGLPITELSSCGSKSSS